MILEHPNIAGAILLVVAILAGLRESFYSPFDWSAGGGIGRSRLKKQYDDENILSYQVLGAIKWVSIGALLAIAVVSR